jgi:hypothetical protein
VDNPRFQKLVEAGEVEIVGEDTRATGGTGGDKRGRTAFYGPTSSSGIRRTGDR